MSLRDSLIKHEGERLKVYKCPANKWTIGVGRCLETNPLSPQEVMALGATQDDLIKGHEITQDQSRYLLDNDIERFTAQVNKALPWMVSRSQSTQDAVVEMAFQMGMKGVLGFPSMLACLQAGDYEGAKKHALDSKWARDDSPARAKDVVEGFKP